MVACTTRAMPINMQFSSVFQDLNCPSRQLSEPKQATPNEPRSISTSDFSGGTCRMHEFPPAEGHRASRTMYWIDSMAWCNPHWSSWSSGANMSKLFAANWSRVFRNPAGPAPLSGICSGLHSNYRIRLSIRIQVICEGLGQGPSRLPENRD